MEYIKDLKNIYNKNNKLDNLDNLFINENNFKFFKYNFLCR